MFVTQQPLTKIIPEEFSLLEYQCLNFDIIYDLSNVWSYLFTGGVKHPRRLESSASPLKELQIS
jgi:hypothetical protein